MKIAFFTFFLDSYSGAATQAFRLAESLSAHGIKIVFFNRTNGKRRYEQRSGFIVYHYNNIVLLINAVQKEQSKGVIDIFHVHGFNVYILIMLMMLRRKIVLKTTLEGQDDYKSLLGCKSKGKWIIKRKILKGIDLNIALTEHLLNINENMIPGTCKICIPNGIDTNKYEYTSQKEVLFCIIGGVCKRKRTLEAMTYFARFYSKLPEARLFVIGPYTNFSECDNSYTMECLKLAGSIKGISMLGNVENDEIMNILKRALAIIHFSCYEGLPNAVIEAMTMNVVPIFMEGNNFSSEMLPPELLSKVTVVNENQEVEIGTITNISSSQILRTIAQEKYDLNIISKRYLSQYNHLMGINCSANA